MSRDQPTAAAFCVGLGASRTAEAWPPGEWGNGTQHTGIALQGVTLNGIEPQRVDVVIPKDGKQEPKEIGFGSGVCGTVDASS